MKVEKRERMKQKDLCWVLSISISKIEKKHFVNEFEPNKQMFFYN